MTRKSIQGAMLSVSAAALLASALVSPAFAQAPQIDADDTPRRMGLERGRYIVVTLHRPSNVDRRETLDIQP